MQYSNFNKILFIIISVFIFDRTEIKAQSASICQGDSAVLRMNCAYFGSLQWQYSSNLILWTNINGAVLDTIKVKPAATSYYRAVITNGTCRLAYSDTALITVNAIPPSPIISTINNCGNSTLTASGFTGTLLWSAGQTVNPIVVNSAGIYTLTQTLNGCQSSAGSATASPISAPPAPTAGTNTPTKIQILWNWNTATGATGYKYNIVNNYSAATDNLSGISYTQTGLTCNTSYTLYVWAYNSCGSSAALILTQTTSNCCVANAGTACDKGGWQLQSGCDANYGCAAFLGIYYGNPSGNCNGANSSSFVEYPGPYCTYVGYAYYDPFHYPQPPNGSCFDSYAAGYSSADTYTKVIPGSGCTHYVWVSDMSGIVQCDGACQ